MSALSDLPEIVGFFSYSREDDEGSYGALSGLRDAIQRELGAQLGRSRANFRVWQDRAAIPHGALWEKEIGVSIAQAVFFVPIVTPRAVASIHCLKEFQAFLSREAELQRDDLIFPILYITVPGLEVEATWRQDPLLHIVGTRQYIDWRTFRHQHLSSPDVRLEIERFCQNIAQALRKRSPISEQRTAEVIDSATPRTTDMLESSKLQPHVAQAGRPVTISASGRAASAKPLWPFIVGTCIAVLVVASFVFWFVKMPPAPTLSRTKESIAFTSLSPEREKVLQAGDSFRECATCPTMVVVPAGSFTMGSPSGEALRRDDEGPQHRVSFAKPFAIGKFAVTFDEWDACVATGGCNSYSPPDYSWGRGLRPVVAVSWSDAKAYAAWLSNRTGRAYRLLTEAEREYATRAGTTTVYSFGDEPRMLDQYGWYNANSGSQTHPVGEKKPNGFGLYDMHGNVWDWIEDCYNATYTGAPSDGGAWTTGDCNVRINRGGSWYAGAEGLRAARRGRTAAATRTNNFGFRLASPLRTD